MTNTIKTLLAAGALVVGAQQSNAITFVDVDNINHALTPATPYLNGLFDISNPEAGDNSITIANPPYSFAELGGFTLNSNPTYVPVGDLTAASIQFWIRNALGDSFVVTVDGDVFTPSSANGNILYFSQSGITGSIVTDLEADGQVAYSVSIVSGSAILDYARLSVDGTSASVPDGGATAMLLGLGFIGAAAIRRKVS